MLAGPVLRQHAQVVVAADEARPQQWDVVAGQREHAWCCLHDRQVRAPQQREADRCIEVLQPEPAELLERGARWQRLRRCCGCVRDEDLAAVRGVDDASGLVHGEET